MSIQILNGENIALQINDVDREICKLWSVEYNEKYYATPKNERNIYIASWFDTLCKIPEIEKQSVDIPYLKERYLKPFIEMDFQGWNTLSLEDKMKDLYTDPIIAPYLKVLDYWIENKYTINYIAD